MKATTLHRSLLFPAVLVLLAVVPAFADTYIVDRFDDTTIDTCSLFFNDCALRGAIIKANQHPGDDIVNLGTGTYTLAIAGNYEDFCQTGDLDVRDTLIIDGEGPERTFIDAAGIDRVLQVIAPGAGLTLRGVAIRGGNPNGAAPQNDGGAGIRLSSGWLHVESCHIVDERGLPRPRDGGGPSLAISDIGAIELAGVGEIFVETFECGFTTGWSGSTP